MESLEESLRAFITDSLQVYLTELLCGWMLGEKLDSPMVFKCDAIDMTLMPNRKLTKTILRVAAGYLSFAGRKNLYIEYRPDSKVAIRLEERIKEGINLWDMHHK